MQVALFADVHGNLPALELFLKATQQADQYISLGDMVNYGPWSNECVQLIETLEAPIKIAGNHEGYFLSKDYPGQNEIAKTFFRTCIGGFSEDRLIEKYTEDATFQGYHLLHTIDNKIIFKDTAIDIGTDTIIAHSHQQYISTRNGFKLINPGSIGQNRTYINVINYINWDTESDTFEQCELLYDVSIVINEMKARKYPDICIDYYNSKKRA